MNVTDRIKSSKRYNQLVLITLSIAHFVDDSLVRGFSILLPFLQSELNLTYLDVSLLGSARSAISAIGNPLMGWISDKSGKRRLLLILGIIGFFLGTAAIGLTKNLFHLLIILMITQLFASVYHPQATSILNFVFHDHIHSAIGIHGAIGAIGLVVSPILLSLAADFYGWRIAPTLVYTPMVVVSIILIILVIADPEEDEKSTFNFSLIRENFLSISLLSLYSGLHTMFFLNSSLFLPLYLENIKNFTIIEIGFWIGMSSVGNIIGQGVVGFGAEKIGTRKLIFITSVLYGLFFYMFLKIDNNLVQLLLLILFSASNAASFPLVMSICTEIVDKRAVTFTFGIIMSITGVTRVMISPIMGYLADSMGLLFSMFVSLIPIVLAGFIVFGIRKRE